MLLALAVSAEAVDRYVATNGRDFTAIGTPNDCTNIAYAPCRTIQHAINQTAGNWQDRVKVQYGTYYENITIDSQVAYNPSSLHLNISGGWGYGFTEQNINLYITTINGSPSGSVINIDADGVLYFDLTIRGFTLTGGNAERGGAVYVRSKNGAGATQVMLIGNTITGNSARYDGGAIYAVNYFSNSNLYLSIFYNTITDNSANYYSGSIGGAISARNYDGELVLRLRGNRITDNIAYERGGGIFVYTQNSNATTTVDLTRNIITGNSVFSGWGAAVALWAKINGTIAADFTNNIVADNKVISSGRGIIRAETEENGTINLDFTNDTITDNQGGHGTVDSDNRGFYSSAGVINIDIVNTILWGNDANSDLSVDFNTTVNASYSDIGEIDIYDIPPYKGTYNDNGGNINADPLFVNPASGDYHLTSSSPCIDAGTNTDAPLNDFEGDVRPYDGDGDTVAITDIGADEYVGTVPWTQISGRTPSAPALVWNSVANEFQMVVQGIRNNQIWASTFDSSGTFNNDWTLIPGSISSAPALAWNPVASEFQMVVRGTRNNQIWASTFDSSGTFNNDWTLLSGRTPSAPALAWNSAANEFQMVVQGIYNGEIWASTFDSSGAFNNDWTLLTGRTADAPALAWNSVTNEVLMVVRHSDNTIWASTFDASGTFNNDWTLLPGRTPSAPALAWNPVASEFQMVVQGIYNGEIWASTFDSSGTFNYDWTLLSGRTPSAPALAWNPVNSEFLIVVRHSDDTIWTTLY